MILPGSPLSILPTLAPSIKQLAAAKWPSHNRGPAAAGSRLAYLELVGVLSPGYMGRFRQSLTKAASDSAVRAIIVSVNSPGGACEGCAEAAEVVRRYAPLIPLHFVCEGWLCSGAYFIAAQATSITASPSTVVGSIGTILTLADDSEFWAAMGVKFLHISTGINKTAGYPGQPILEQHVAMLQRLVDGHQVAFEVAVERGRKLTPQQLAKVNDGSVFTAGRAKNLGLVDAVQLPEDRYAELDQLHAEKYTDLTGQAAVAQLDRLVVHPTQSGCRFADAPRSIQEKLRAEYPTLVAAAGHEQTPRGSTYTGYVRH